MRVLLFDNVPFDMLLVTFCISLLLVLGYIGHLEVLMNLKYKSVIQITYRYLFAGIIL